DDALARHVATALRPHLVLQEGAGRADADELVDRPLDVEGVAVARVDVDDQRPVDRADDAPGGLDHLGLGEEPQVGLGEAGGREAVAGEEDDRKAGEFRQHGAQCIIDAGENERLARPEELRDRVHGRPCHDSRALQKERVPGQEGGARAMAARLPHEFTTIDPAVRREVVDLEPVDGWPGGAGLLYRPPHRDPDVAVLAMHPRVDFNRHYLAPGLAAAGYAFLGAPTRYLNHDADALHERLLCDVAAAIRALRARGFAKVVLLGNSGGGSLFAFYLE